MIHLKLSPCSTYSVLPVVTVMGNGEARGKWWVTGTKEKVERQQRPAFSLERCLRSTQFLLLLVMCIKKFTYQHTQEIFFFFLYDFILLILVFCNTGAVLWGVILIALLVSYGSNCMVTKCMDLSLTV